MCRVERDFLMGGKNYWFLIGSNSSTYNKKTYIKNLDLIFSSLAIHVIYNIFSNQRKKNDLYIHIFFIVEKGALNFFFLKYYPIFLFMGIKIIQVYKFK